MKKILVGIALLGAFIISQTASADNRHYRGYSNYNNGYSANRYSPRRPNSYHYGRSRSNNYSNRFFYNRGYNRGYNRSYNRGYNRNYYNYSNRYRYNRRNYNRRYRYRDNHYDVGSFVGGLILGSIFSSSYSTRSYDNSYVYRNPPVTRTQEVVYVNSPASRSTKAPVRQVPASGKSLLKDLQGNCFERTTDAQGNEVRVQLEDRACNF